MRGGRLRQTTDGPTCSCFATASSSLYHNDGGNRFSDVTQIRHHRAVIRFSLAPRHSLDVDHDGDLDLLIAGLCRPGREPRARGGTRAARSPASSRPRRCGCCATTAAARSPTRRPRRGCRSRRAPSASCQPTSTTAATSISSWSIAAARRLLFQNLRDGTFKDVAADVGLAAAVGRSRTSPRSRPLMSTRMAFRISFFGRFERRHLRAERRPWADSAPRRAPRWRPGRTRRAVRRLRR